MPVSPLALFLSGTVAPPPVTFASVASINTEGWSAHVTSPPTFDPVNTPLYVAVSRAGYDQGGNATTYNDYLILTQRVRQAYPSQASLDATRCAMSEYVYSTDTVVGVTNNSTVASPQPVANWVTPHRLTVGNTLTAEIVAFHRDARKNAQVACVVFSATDGTTTVTQTVSAATVSGRTGDQNAVIVYACSLDITSLNNNALITLNAKVYPWLGNSSSVLDSSTNTPGLGSATRGFTPRYFLKSTTLVATPRVVYVNSAGNDSTGVASTTDATAFASPCLTVNGALGKLMAAGVYDNAIIYISNTVGTGSGFVGFGTQNVGALVITRDPRVSQATAVFTLDNTFRPFVNSALTSPLTSPAVRFTDLTIKRSGANVLFGESAGAEVEAIFDNVTFDNQSVATTWLANTSDYFFGCTFQNVGTTVFTCVGDEHRCYRGCTGDLNGNVSEVWLHVGNTWTRSGKLDHFGSGNTPVGRTAAGSITAFNKFLNPIITGDAVIDLGATENATGIAIVQNLFENIGTASFPLLGLFNDGLKGNSTHLILHNNAFTGYGVGGRSNALYDETSGTLRTHILQSFKGNIHVLVANKGDVFITDGTHVGNWGYYYGVGCRGEFMQFNPAGSGADFAQVYYGLDANIGSSLTVRNDPLFTNYQGTGGSAGTPSAGAGGGTYTLQGTSPCKGAFKTPVLPYDLAGTARSSPDSSGCYA